MKKILSLMVLLCFVGGCEQPAGPSESDKMFKHIKLKELAPTRKTDPNDRPMAADFAVYVFSVSASQLGAMEKVWKSYQDVNVAKRNARALAAGDFAVVSADNEKWNAIAEQLNAIGGKNNRTLGLILPQDKGHFMALSNFKDEVTIFVPSEYGQAKGVTVGAGKSGFYMAADSRAGGKGVSVLSVTPAFEPVQQRSNSFSPLVEQELIKFEDMRVSVKMSAGSFMLIGPKYTPERMSIAEMFFKQDMDVMLYLIVCNRVVD